MNQNILEIHHLSKDYGTFRLEDVSFSLPRGVIMGLIGENGAGKSTTINCILGEVQKSGGDITLFGQAQAASEKENKDRIGVVFDENHFPDLFTPKELGQVMAGVYSHWDWAAYHAFLARFSLREDQKIKDFSKGMKVKLAFAVALSHGAELLILDEATSGLDPIVRDEVLDLLDELRNQLPVELKRAQELLAAREKFVDEAKRDVERMMRQADLEAKSKVSDSEVLYAAKEKARKIIADAEDRSRQLCQVANEYAEDALARTEEAVQAALTEVKQSRSAFRAASAAKLQEQREKLEAERKTAEEEGN